MTNEDRQMIVTMFAETDNKLNAVLAAINQRLNVKMVLDITDDRVAMVMQIVQVYDTPEGVIIKVVKQ